MRNRRILPAMVASTVWPFGKWTRNVVLGSTAATMPSSSIASSLAIGTPFAKGVASAKAGPAHWPSPALTFAAGRLVGCQGEVKGGNGQVLRYSGIGMPGDDRYPGGGP